MGLAVTAAGVSAQERTQVREFPVSAVRLLPSPYAKAMEANGRYLLQLEPDRLLHGFRQSAGLKPKAERYGGWESMGVAGHTLGHYLTACSYQYAATGDARYRDRVVTIVRELAECQEKRGDGYIGAIPDADRVWSEIRKGDIRSKGFDLNGLWVPWYTIHKVLAGLIDASQIAKVPEALPIARRLGEWTGDLTKDLTPAQWQTMLACEHGGMNESLAELFALTGDERFRTLARKFHHDAVLTPLARREDRLAGLHSNTQIPKLIGLARLYELEGKPEDRTAAEFFWDRIARHRTFAMGGNSNHEHLGPADRLNDQLSASSAETCNTYNMLKLTRHLDAWQPKAEWFDFYERALTNHILATQRPADGMVTYFVPLQPKATRPFSTPFESFWCCVGTGIENHARYGEAIYTHRDGELRVNLFIPSQLDATPLGSRVRMEANLPHEDRVCVTIDAADAREWTLAVRQPAWVAKAPTFWVNGKAAKLEKGDDGYLRLKRAWRVGDVVEWTLPMALRTEPMPDNPNRLALMYGPVVLAAKHAKGESGPEPVLVPGRKGVESWLERIPGKSLRFRSRGVVRPVDLEFIPFHEAIDGPYTTYLDRFSADEWRKREREIRAEEAARAAEEAATVDAFRPGEMQPERDHDFQGERTETGEHQGRKWRHAIDGWFSFRLKVDPKADQELSLTYWSGDTGRQYDVLVDGVRIAGPPTEMAGPPRFVTVRYPLGRELLAGKSSVTVRFTAKPGSIAGGLYGARILRKSGK